MLNIGTCSWNYDCWNGLIYDHPCSSASEYLSQYSKHFSTVEIDSWFYRIPSKKDVLAYKNNVPSDFKFTVKAPQQITLTHLRQKSKTDPLISNPDFLSLDLFNRFLESIEPLLSQIPVIMFEFEYLNKSKMSSVNELVDKLGKFISLLPTDLNYGIEPRNSNYLTKPYFDFIKESNLIHVLSEKQFLPHVYDIYDKYKEAFGKTIVIRLLGGDRKEIEELTNEKWTKIVKESQDLNLISSMISRMLDEVKDFDVYINVNNHYEGSAPLTINKILSLVR